jgi:metallo-beta-lactamase family protein
MHLKFCGSAQTVTGASFLVTSNDRKLLVDCGLFQGSKAVAERNYGSFPYDPRSIDAVLLTHAHIDHTGLLPKLVKHGFRGPVYATAPTADLCSIMLPDSAYIQETEVERKNRKLARQGQPLLEPIYTMQDAAATMELFRPVAYGERLQLFPGIEAEFRTAGHVLGSAFIEIFAREDGGSTSVLFSGDVGADNRPLVPDPDEAGSPDYVVMEATYGDRVRTEENDEKANYEALGAIIRDTFRRGGNVIIPAFAVERTQDLLYDLNRLIHAGAINPNQVYVDSPLAVEATKIFARHVDLFDDEAQHFRQISGNIPIYFPNLHLLRTWEESAALNKVKSGAIIISASGMCTAGRIKHHLKHHLWRPECSVVFVGYQAQGTLGRRILDGEPVVRIHGEEVQVRAQIHELSGFSAHADQLQLLNWAATLARPPRCIFLVHGEEVALTTLADLLRTKLHFTVEIPHHLAEYGLERTPLAIEAGEALGIADALSPTLWGTTRRLFRAFQELEKSEVPQSELERLLEQAEALRAAIERTTAKRSVA